jgi:AcrR family transcriptional regulator
MWCRPEPFGADWTGSQRDSGPLPVIDSQRRSRVRGGVFRAREPNYVGGGAAGAERSAADCFRTIVRAKICEPVNASTIERADGRRARGDRTRQAILEEAIQIASAEGLEGLSIGGLAGRLGVSKSGLFAHFGSKTELQVATVEAAREVFLDEVIGSARADGGIEEVLSLTDAWLDYMEREVFRGGCFFVAASSEFDSRPGPVRDAVVGLVSEWLIALEAAIQDAQEADHLPAELEAPQLAFELHSLGMGANLAFKLYGDKAAFERARAAIRERLAAAGATGTAWTGIDQSLEALERQLDEAETAVPTEVDEGAARRTLREQIARLELELASLFTSTRPGDGVDWQVRSPGGPRVLDVGDLESLRDELAGRVEDIRRAMREQAEAQHEKRAHLEDMSKDPGGHKWERISNEDLGEPGCKHYHATPRLGLVGMLMGWWRVKVSSGCP